MDPTFQDKETTRKCGFFNLNTLGSASGIQIKESTLSHRFSTTETRGNRYDCN